MIKGLTGPDAASRLKSFGFNELPSAKPRNMWAIAVDVVKEPMLLLLISCASLYMLLGDYREGIVLLASILFIVFIAFYQSRKTERALESLRKLSSPRALVIRDGIQIRIPGREVVPGDLLILQEGDRIAADARLLDAQHLLIDESLLTGESAPVEKSTNQNESIVFSGTLVIRGAGTAEVLHTGTRSKFGKIGTSLEGIGRKETRLQSEMKLLIRNLFLLGIFLCSGIVIAFYFSRGGFIQSLLNGLAAAMAILPEEFPVVLTVFLALGAWRLSLRKVLTRQPSAIETLGAATVLCTDKTGTITLNKMQLTGIQVRNELIPAHNVQLHNSAQAVLETAYAASPKTTIDPMELAISQLYKTIIKSAKTSEIIKEFPITNQLKAMCNIVKFPGAESTTASCKGAPEAVLALCNASQVDTEKVLHEVTHLASQGFRILAVAQAINPADTFFDKLEQIPFQYLGLLVFADPIRQEVPEAVAQCAAAGIKIVLITGDYPETAISIAKQAGIDVSNGVITGTQIDALTDAELRSKMNINIFARVVPEHKLRIVKALQANGEVVAMTGDGVNDAPALKAADIGIAMGNKGTDVAREASSLVLLDDNFASIVTAIRLGRRIFDNLQKAMSYILAIHIPIIGLTMLPAFFIDFPVLLFPLHIIFLELIIDPVCSIAFESEQEEQAIMSRLPRNPNAKFFGRKSILLSVFKGILLLAVVLGVYYFSNYEQHTDGEIRAITFTSLILGNLFFILSALSTSRSFMASLLEGNLALLSILFLASSMLLSLLLIPSLSNLFNFEFPGLIHFLPSIVASFILLLILEIAKKITVNC